MRKREVNDVRGLIAMLMGGWRKLSTKLMREDPLETHKKLKKEFFKILKKIKDY
jgi:hypothetical protein